MNRLLLGGAAALLMARRHLSWFDYSSWWLAGMGVARSLGLAGRSRSLIGRMGLLQPSV
jgi:hypothetical protein